MPVQNAGEDQVGESDGVLRRLSHSVGQVPLVEPLVERAAEGVQEEDCLGLLGPRPERFVRRVGQLTARGMAGDLHAAQPLFEGMLEGAYREPRVLQRYEAESAQSVGGGGTMRRRRLAREPVYLLGRILVRPVVV